MCRIVIKETDPSGHLVVASCNLRLSDLNLLPTFTLNNYVAIQLVETQ